MYLTHTDATPILDRLLPLPEPSAQRFRITLGVCIGLGVAIVATVMLWHSPLVRSLRQWVLLNLDRMLQETRTGSGIIFFCFSMSLIVFVGVLIHELGHVVAGRWAGFGCGAIHVGPLQINPPFRISFNRSPGAWFRGGAVMFPGKTDHLRIRGIAMAAGGPAANLLSGCAVYLLPFPKGFFSGFFIVSSITAGLVELLLPLEARTFAFDGSRILMMLRDCKRGERWLALMALAAEIRGGKLPELLSSDLLVKVTAVGDNSAETVIGHAYAYSAAFHQHKNEEAGQMLETCLKYSNNATPELREALMSDAAVFQARRRKRADLAEQWLLDLPKSNRWLHLRAQAAILEAHGDVVAALKMLEEIEKEVLSRPDESQRQFILPLLRRWRFELSG